MKDVLNLAGRRRVVVGEAEGKTSTGIRGIVKGITKPRKSFRHELLVESARGEELNLEPLNGPR